MLCIQPDGEYVWPSPGDGYYDDCKDGLEKHDRRLPEASVSSGYSSELAATDTSKDLLHSALHMWHDFERLDYGVRSTSLGITLAVLDMQQLYDEFIGKMPELHSMDDLYSWMGVKIVRTAGV